ncbi:MAG: DegT/DnrJ/EryC1/StrS family aminotransferase, partial [Acidimicrobiales bacterium]
AALEIGPGDEVICPADSFLLTTAFAAANRATVVFADLDPRSLHLDPEAVEAAVTPRTRAIVAVDRYGTTGDYHRLRPLAARHGLALVEDATASIGAVFDNTPVGALGTASFCSLGEAGTSLGVAGLFATDDDGVAAKARRVMLVDDDLDSPGFDLESGVVGGSYRLAELDATLASAELALLGDDAPTRVANGKHLRRRLDGLAGIRAPEVVAGATNVYTSFPLVVVPDELGLDEEASSALRDTLVDCMTAEGLRLDRWRARTLPAGDTRSRRDLYAAAVPPVADPLGETGPGFDLACRRSSFPVAENAWAGGLVLAGRQALGPPNSEVEMDAVVDCFVKVLVDNVDRLRQLTLERREPLP